MKKKILIGLGIFFGVIVAAIVAAVIYFWPFLSSVDWSIVNVSNMKALYTAFTQDEETINNTLKEIDDQRSEEIKSYLDMDIRDFTEEELEQIEKGEVTKTQLIAQIIAENVEVNNEEEYIEDEEIYEDEIDGNAGSSSQTSDKKSNQETNGDNETADTTDKNTTDKDTTDKNTTSKTDKNTTSKDTTNKTDKNKTDKNTTSKNDKNTTSGQSSSNKTQSSAKTETADQIVSRHIAKLYSYYSQFQGRVDSLTASAKSWTAAYYKSTGCTWKQAKAAAVSHFTGTASQIESDCYAKVDAQIAQLRQDLKAIGADTSIADSVAASAYSEMEAKKSQIVQQGMARLNK